MRFPQIRRRLHWMDGVAATVVTLAVTGVLLLATTQPAGATNFQGSSGGCSIGIALTVGSYYAKVSRSGGTCGSGTQYRARVNCVNTSTGVGTTRTGPRVSSGSSQANCICPCPSHEHPDKWGVGIYWPDNSLHNHWMVQ